MKKGKGRTTARQLRNDPALPESLEYKPIPDTYTDPMAGTRMDSHLMSSYLNPSLIEVPRLPELNLSGKTPPYPQYPFQRMGASLRKLLPPCLGGSQKLKWLMQQRVEPSGGGGGASVFSETAAQSYKLEFHQELKLPSRISVSFPLARLT